MRAWRQIGSAMLAIAVSVPAFAQVVPLDEDQRLDLATTIDDTTNFMGDAGFFALLENAAQWQPGNPGMAVWDPELKKVYEDPGQWRGRVCRIKGTLATMWELPDLGPEWKDVRSIIVTVEGGKPVIVFLTNPPALRLIGESERGNALIAEEGYDIALYGRFLKRIARPQNDGTERSYLIFVGHSAAELTPPADAGSGDTWKAVVLVVAAIVLLGGYMVLRGSMRRRTAGPSAVDRLHQYRQRRDRDRAAPSDDVDDDAPLSDDPYQALQQLDSRADRSPRR